MGKCTVCNEDKIEKIVKAGDEMIVAFDLRNQKDGNRHIHIKDHTTVAGKHMIVDTVILGNRDLNHYKCLKRYVNHKGINEWWDMDGTAKRIDNLEKNIKELNHEEWDVRVVLLKKEIEGKDERRGSKDSSRSKNRSSERSRSTSHGRT
jgi:hypothetical protein